MCLFVAIRYFFLHKYIRLSRIFIDFLFHTLTVSYLWFVYIRRPGIFSARAGLNVRRTHTPPSHNITYIHSWPFNEGRHLGAHLQTSNTEINHIQLTAGIFFFFKYPFDVFYDYSAPNLDIGKRIAAPYSVF